MSDTKEHEAVSSEEELMETDQVKEENDLKREIGKADDQEPSDEEKPKVKEEIKEEKTPKKASPKKKPQEEEDDEDEEDSEEEELQPGLLERPLIIESGKREKKKVERLDMSSSSTPKEKKQFEEGSGMKLGDIPRVEYFLNRMVGDDLKPLHRLLYNRPGSTNEVKRNIRKFSGYPFDRNSKEYEKKTVAMTKYTTTMLKSVCEACDLEKSGTKEMIMQRVIDFLMCPKSSGKKLPEKKKKKEKGEKRKRKSKKEKEKDKPKKTKKVKSKEKAGSDDEDSDDSEDGKEDSENSKKVEKSSEASDEDSDLEVDSSSEEEEIIEEPKKKKVPTATLR